MIDPAERALDLLQDHVMSDSMRINTTGLSVFVRGRRYCYEIRSVGTTHVFRHGQVIGKSCIQPMVYMPSYDRMLAEYLLIRADEDRYLKTANISWHFPSFPEGLVMLSIAVALATIIYEVVHFLR